jgi:hypothetical protein
MFGLFPSKDERLKLKLFRSPDSAFSASCPVVAM